MHVQVSSPLKQRCWLVIFEGDRVWVDFKYEKLPDFCEIFSYLDHNDKNCDDELYLKSENCGIVRGYTSSLKVEIYSPSKNAGSSRLHDDVECLS